MTNIVSTLFVFHHFLCFIMICVSSQFVFHHYLYVGRELKVSWTLQQKKYLEKMVAPFIFKIVSLQANIRNTPLDQKSPRHLAGLWETGGCSTNTVVIG